MFPQSSIENKKLKRLLKVILVICLIGIAYGIWIFGDWLLGKIDKSGLGDSVVSSTTESLIESNREDYVSTNEEGNEIIYNISALSEEGIQEKEEEMIASNPSIGTVLRELHSMDLGGEFEGVERVDDYFTTPKEGFTLLSIGYYDDYSIEELRVYDILSFNTSLRLYTIIDGVYAVYLYESVVGSSRLVLVVDYSGSSLDMERFDSQVLTVGQYWSCSLVFKITKLYEIDGYYVYLTRG